jgi:acyl carrier protein
MLNDDAHDRFIDLLREYLPLAGPGGLDASTGLDQLGLDSLNTVEILIRLEDEFGVQIPDEELNAATFATVDSLWTTLNRYAGSDLSHA